MASATNGSSIRRSSSKGDVALFWVSLRSDDAGAPACSFLADWRKVPGWLVKRQIPQPPPRRRGWCPLGLPALVVATAALAWATPLGQVLSLSLERRFPRPDEISLHALNGIIVLAGDYARFQAGVALAAAHPILRLVLVTEPKTERIRALALGKGISEERMTFELQSTNTYENAIYTRHLLTGADRPVSGRWLLVTGGIHMPRAVGVFRHAGFDVVPYLVFATEYPHHRHHLWLALWEWAGLVLYHARGRTDALWP
jgi:uncharacterized SAM-binding protein YcdF (DUF218 family)